MSENSPHVATPDPGDTVYWLWYGKMIHGVVQEVIPKSAGIVSKGKFINRNGTTDNPAVIISYKNGNHVIKLASELSLPKNT